MRISCFGLILGGGLTRSQTRKSLWRRIRCQRFAPGQNGGVVSGEGAQDVGKGGFAPAVFSEDKGARPESRMVGWFGHLKPPDVLNQFDFFEHPANPLGVYGPINRAWSYPYEIHLSMLTERTA